MNDFNQMLDEHLELGQLIIQYFGLKPEPDGLYKTEYGPKSEAGIAIAIKDFVENGK